MVQSFFLSFGEQITDFYNLLKEDMSSLFVLLVWGSISVSPLMNCSLHLVSFGEAVTGQDTMTQADAVFHN
jgi:hypothetical protein